MLAEQKLTSCHNLLSRIAEARARTDELFEILQPDSLYERPIPERHRIIFYVGHLEAFDWNLLRERLFNAKSLNPGFDRLFAFGIDPVGGGLPNDRPEDWPSIHDVRAYVRDIRQAIDAAVQKLDLPDANGDPSNGPEFSPGLLLNVAIEHRLMHAETLAYMLHQSPLESKIPTPYQSPTTFLTATEEMVEIPSGAATLGIDRAPDRFGWDNEFEEHTVAVPAFAIDRYMVTNRQYLEFITAGGYEEKAFWTADGWIWRTAHNISHPVFWKQRNGQWYYRSMFHEFPLPLEWPVYVSHAEASAYARWAGKGLPSEAQWHRAAYGTPQGVERAFPWGGAEPTSKPGNFDFQSWDPSPVAAFTENQSAFGVAGLLGNGWEWTSSLFEPFPGFRAFPFYPGYSADFFDGKHYVMKGASPRTAACMLRRSFRNWFQPHYQYVYAGFRCVST